MRDVRALLADAKARPPGPQDPEIDGMKPSLVLEPGSVEAAAEALAFCQREDLAVVPKGAGTRLHVGNLAARLDCYLSSVRLTGVIDYEPSDLTVTVRSGTPLAKLQDELEREKQFLPWDPPLADLATVGGILASGEPGFRRRPGARPRDLLLGFEALLADGTEFKAGGCVVKNVAGYELMKLVVGSWGTLAFLTEAHLRVRPVPEANLTLAVSFADPSQVSHAVSSLRREAVQPEVVAVVDPSLAAVVSLQEWSLLLRFEGLEEEVDGSRRQTEKILSAREVAKLVDEESKGLWSALRDFPTPEHSELIVLGQVLPSQTLELADRWQGRGPVVAYPEAGLVYTRTGDPEDHARLFSEAQVLQGNAVLEAGPQHLKAEVDVFGEIPSGFELMKRIKGKLDPKGVLSPGRFVGRL
jgi:glycolate oxidase FAD binding subunit